MALEGGWAQGNRPWEGTAETVQDPGGLGSTACAMHLPIPN
jgi:hypothetical protein